MRRKILFVINSLAGGGAERVFATLLRGSGDRLAAHDCAVVLLDREEEAYPLPDGLRVVRLDTGGGLRRGAAELARLVARERPDTALSFLTRANVATVWAMRRARRPAIISERVNTTAHLGGGRRGLASRALVRLAYPRAERVIAVSDGVADTLVDGYGVRRARVSVIANPVDIDRIEQLAAEPVVEPVAEPPYAVAMGRLAPNKNFRLAIRAFAASGRPGRLVLMGQGPEEGALREEAGRLGLGDRLVMPGFVANPYAVLARADLMLLPSNAEGFPNALVEGMAAGVPVVATDCRSGPAEVLAARVPAGGAAPVAGRGGLLVPVDDVEAMTTAIRRLDDPATRAALATEGRRRVRDFGVGEAVRRYWSVIDGVLDGRR